MRRPSSCQNRAAVLRVRMTPVALSLPKFSPSWKVNVFIHNTTMYSSFVLYLEYNWEAKLRKCTRKTDLRSSSRRELKSRRRSITVSSDLRPLLSEIHANQFRLFVSGSDIELVQTASRRIFEQLGIYASRWYLHIPHH